MMEIKPTINTILFDKVTIAPLVTFRVLFGLVMFVSILRFWANGWIETQFIEPAFHFKYFGFYWVSSLPDVGFYFVFGLMAICALAIALGAFYRLASILFFLSFTYIELVDATYYLNHYYFVSVVALVMIFLPANRLHSLDVKLGFTQKQNHTSAWTINLIKFQLALVYFLAGLAKLNADWLLEAMPLAIWLPAQDQLPIVGSLFQYKATAYIFSWGGALYDLSIPFLLIYRSTRWLAYAGVVVFHLLTWFLFQIGMFPFIMIAATLVFFSGSFHEKLHSLFGFPSIENPVSELNQSQEFSFTKAFVIGAFSLIQLLIPFRHVLYPGNMFWHEQGYRFGWRVMLTEKAGYAQFKVEDDQGRIIEVSNQDFLTPVQEKMMSTQSDFMLQYADFLKAHYTNLGIAASAVKADVFVTMNGRASQRFIDSSIDLASIEDGFANKEWILPMETRSTK